MKKTSASEIRLLTNHLELAATTIGAIYKERWQIELFFKTSSRISRSRLLPEQVLTLCILRFGQH
jgi:IS4 transposase